MRYLRTRYLKQERGGDGHAGGDARGVDAIVAAGGTEVVVGVASLGGRFGRDGGEVHFKD